MTRWDATESYDELSGKTATTYDDADGNQLTVTDPKAANFVSSTTAGTRLLLSPMRTAAKPLYLMRSGNVSEVTDQTAMQPNYTYDALGRTHTRNQRGRCCDRIRLLRQGEQHGF